MGNLLALDASSKRTGWALLKNETIEYGVISSTSTSAEKRITVMRDSIIDLIKKYDITEIVMEEVRPDNTNTRTETVLKWLQGCIVVAVYEYNKNIKINFIGASSWRSALGIQGYRIKRDEQKQRDINYANKLYNLNLTSEQDDEADAICILTAYNKNAVTAPIKKQNGPIGSEESAF